MLLFNPSVTSNSLWPHGLQHAQLPVLHYLLEFAQTHVHWVSDAIQSSHPLSPLLLLPSFACISFLPEPLETLHKISSIVFNSLLDTCISHQHISLMSKTDRRKETKCCPIFFFPSMLLLSVFSSVMQSCLTLCDLMVCSMPGFPVHHQLPELTQTLVNRVSDAIQPSLAALHGC